MPTLPQFSLAGSILHPPCLKFVQQASACLHPRRPRLEQSSGILPCFGLVRLRSLLLIATSVLIFTTLRYLNHRVTGTD